MPNLPLVTSSDEEDSFAYQLSPWVRIRRTRGDLRYELRSRLSYEDFPNVSGNADSLDQFVLLRGSYRFRGTTTFGFVNDFATPQNTMKSWDMVARYVMPEVNGQLASMRDSNEFVINHREYFLKAQQAVLNKIMENERAAEAFRTGPTTGAPIAAHYAPTRESLAD